MILSDYAIRKSCSVICFFVPNSQGEHQRLTQHAPEHLTSVGFTGAALSKSDSAEPKQTETP